MPTGGRLGRRVCRRMDQGHVDKLIAAWGYLGIFICVFVGNLGVPVPEESVVLAAGFLAGQGILDIKFERT